jgi:hypothetical protein
MADPCPDFEADPDFDFLIAEYEDCAGFPEASATLNVVEFLDCAGFPAADETTMVVEYEESGCCCGGCCFTDASVLPDTLYITVDGATFTITSSGLSGGCKTYTGGNGDYGVSELQICAGCNVVGNLFDNLHGGGACGDTSLSPTEVRCWSPFNYFQTVTYGSPGCEGITFDILICEANPCPDLDDCVCRGPDYPLPMSVANPTAARTALPTTEVEPPCPFRGPVVSHCMGCGGNKPGRHSYQCLCDDAEADSCVPAPAKDVGEWVEDGVRACNRCPYRPGSRT